MSKAPRKKKREPIWLKRTVDGFTFAAGIDREMASKWGIGSLVQADITMPRSGRQHRWYWALIRTVWKHQDTYKTPEALHFVLKIRLGLVDMVMVGGEQHFMPQSISYDAMEGGEFNELVDRTFAVISREIIPGMDRKARTEMEKEIDALVR